jgi:hypothetical protein
MGGQLKHEGITHYGHRYPGLSLVTGKVQPEGCRYTLPFTKIMPTQHPDAIHTPGLCSERRLTVQLDHEGMVEQSESQYQMLIACCRRLCEPRQSVIPLVVDFPPHPSFKLRTSNRRECEAFSVRALQCQSWFTTSFEHWSLCHLNDFR